MNITECAYINLGSVGKSHDCIKRHEKHRRRVMLLPEYHGMLFYNNLLIGGIPSKTLKKTTIKYRNFA